MDYSQLPVGLSFMNFSDHMSEDGYSNMSDDEKREYIERNRSRLSEKELETLTSALGEDEGADKIL